MRLTVTLAATAFAGTLAVACAGAAHAAPFGVAAITLPGTQTSLTPAGIDAAGRVAGTLIDTAAGTPVVTGLITGAGGTTIATAGGNVSIGAINAAGAVGGTIQPASGDTRLFTRAPGGPTQDVVTGAISATVTGLNAAGTLTGTVGAQGYVLAGGTLTGFNVAAPTDGTAPTGINAAGTVVGNAIVGGTSTPFTRTAAGLVTLLPVGSGDAFAYGINDAGVIVGDASLSPNTFGDAFILDGAALTILDDPDGIVTHANAINNLGEVAGYYLDADFNQHGYIYQDGRFYTVDAPGAASSQIIAINDAGDFVGSTGSGGAFTGASVPAPGLLLLPMAAAAALARRRG